MPSINRGKLALLTLGLLTAVSSYALPTIGVPNITVNSTTPTPSFISTDSSTQTDAATTKMLQQQITNFSAQIRGSILQSGQFRVVDVDNNFVQTHLPIESAPTTAESAPLVESATIIESSVTVVSKPTDKTTNKTPDYLLIGNLAAINAGEEVNQIINTNKYSDIYSIDLAVDYKLVRTNDRTIVASFTAAGHSGDVKLVNSPDQKMQHNIPLLVQQAGADLAAEVTTQLQAQIGGGKLYLNNQESAPKITDFKTYSD